MSTEATQSSALDTLGSETRTFPPTGDFTRQANASDAAIYDRADKDFEGFWAEQARTLLWRRPFTKVLEWDAPYAKWFADGQLNVSENCLDRHVKAGKGAKVAYHWEGEPGDTRTLTYQDLLDETQRCANALKELGVRKGDRVAIYMPMIPELPVAMLACARIGAPFTVVFGGFSSDSLRDRIQDAGAKVLITGDKITEVGPADKVTIPAGEVKDAELKLAKQLIDQTSNENFEPTKYKDTVRERVLETIQQKIDGQDITADITPGTDTKMIDLMEALKASLAKPTKEKAESKRKVS